MTILCKWAPGIWGVSVHQVDWFWIGNCHELEWGIEWNWKRKLDWNSEQTRVGERLINCGAACWWQLVKKASCIDSKWRQADWHATTWASQQKAAVFISAFSCGRDQCNQSASGKRRPPSPPFPIARASKKARESPTVISDTLWFKRIPPSNRNKRKKKEKEKEKKKEKEKEKKEKEKKKKEKRNVDRRWEKVLEFSLLRANRVLWCPPK